MLKLMLDKFKKALLILLMGMILVSSIGWNNHSYANEDNNLTIAIDAGHYCGEPGKRSPYDSVFDYQKAEIEYNMGISRLVEKKLKAKRPDINIYLTNPNATNQTRGQRAVDAKKHNVDIIYSIHMNAIGDEWQEKISGCCVCINKNSTLETKKMAQDFIDNYSEGTGIKKVASNGIYERGSEVGLLKKATELGIPSILIECDFMDNYQAYRNFSDNDYLDMVSDVIVDSIIQNIDSGLIK